MWGSMSHEPLLGHHHRTIKDLTPEELIGSRLPDEWLVAVWIDFVTQKGRRYTVVYQLSGQLNTSILLSSIDKDYEDFLDVQILIATYTHGTIRGEIVERLANPDDIMDYIYPDSHATQRSIGEAVAGFFPSRFPGVKISYLYYNVPVAQLAFAEAIEQFGFRSERIAV